MLYSYDLTATEKARLRTLKIKLQDVKNVAADELSVLLNVSELRAREIHGFIEFQSVASIGKAFASDLLSLGYYSLEELKDKKGEEIFDALERKVGAWIDPCVEDQCRLIVHVANHPGSKKSWWDFTEERKKFRMENEHLQNRPTKAWHELAAYKKK